jgi:hypothetical protein
MGASLAGVKEIGVRLGSSALFDLGPDGFLDSLEVGLFVTVRLLLGSESLAVGAGAVAGRAGAAAQGELTLPLGCDRLGDGSDAASLRVAVSAGFERMETIGFLDSDSALGNLGLDLSDFVLELSLSFGMRSIRVANSPLHLCTSVSLCNDENDTR